MSGREKTFVIIINESPYGDEKPYSALRIAMSLAKRAQAKVRVFLLGDGVHCAIRDQQTPQGYYNIERMIGYIARRGAVST